MKPLQVIGWVGFVTSFLLLIKMKWFGGAVIHTDELVVCLVIIMFLNQTYEKEAKK